MAIDRPDDWMPVFPPTGRRAQNPAASAPPTRTGISSSSRPEELDSSDDEGTSAVSITNRCSPKAVHAVVSKFSEYKKLCVREIGFDGILDLPCITKVNLKLSSWLLSKLDSEESYLVISEARRIYVHEKDVGIVFGIPCGDVDISSTEITPREVDTIMDLCGLSCPRTFKSLEHVLSIHIDQNSKVEEVHRFKVAFVIYVMGNLLAPSVKHDQSTTDFWGALKDPESIHTFNWCRYVHTLVLEAAQKVRNEVVLKGRVSALMGCHLFLQVLFLDNIDLGRLSMNHNVTPRIKAFNQEVLRQMIVSCASRGEQDFSSFIAIRRRALSGYMRNTCETDEHASMHNRPEQRRPALPPALLPYTNSLGQFSMVPPDEFPLRDPRDFDAYINAKYPSLVRHYVADHFKMENARMMKDIAQLRHSAIRRNARFFDWFVENVGMQNIMRMHKKPPPSSNQGSMTATLSSGCMHQVIPSKPLPMQARSTGSNASGSVNATRSNENLKRTSSYFEDLQVHKLKRQEDLSNSKESDPEGNHVSDKAPFHTEPTLSVPQGHMQYMDHGAHQIPHHDSTLKFDCSDVPSFDLGIPLTPAPQSFVTPLAQIISTKIIPSTTTFPPFPLTHDQHSASTSKLSPRSATVEYASTFVYEQLACLDDASSQPDEVLYAQAVREVYQRATVHHQAQQLNIALSAQKHPEPDDDVVEMLRFCLTNGHAGEMDSILIDHPYPRKLVLLVRDIHDNFISAKQMGDDMIDAVIRRFNQLDITFGDGPAASRWRHFLESDFAMLTIGGQLPHEVQSILHQFIHVDYSIPLCKMVIAPVLVDDVWCAYMFDIQAFKVHVLDPAHNASRQGAHNFFAHKLVDSLCKCALQFFENWCLSPPHDWVIIYPNLMNHTLLSPDSGPCMLQMARHYNGTSLETELDQVSIPSMRQKLIFQALSLSNNIVELPNMLARITR